VGVEQIAEIPGQLLLGQLVDAVVEVGADAADGARVGLDGLRPQPLEPQVFEMGRVLLVERGANGADIKK